MAAGLTFTTIARNAMADAIVDLVDVSGPGTLQIGTNNAGAFGTVLATLTMANPAFSAAATGAASVLSTPRSATASAGGTAAFWRLRDGAAAVILDGTVNTTDNGADITLSTAARNAGLAALNTLINTGSGTATLQITTAADTGFAAPLVTLNMSNPAFGAPSSGTMALSGTLSGSATAAGTAALFRIRNRDSNEVLRGSVGTTGEDINFDNNIFGVGSAISISSYSITLPATSAPSSGVLVFAGGLAFTLGETIQLSSGTFTYPAS